MVQFIHIPALPKMGIRAAVAGGVLLICILADREASSEEVTSAEHFPNSTDVSGSLEELIHGAAIGRPGAAERISAAISDPASASAQQVYDAIVKYIGSLGRSRDADLSVAFADQAERLIKLVRYADEDRGRRSGFPATSPEVARMFAAILRDIASDRQRRDLFAGNPETWNSHGLRPAYFAVEERLLATLSRSTPDSYTSQILSDYLLMHDAVPKDKTQLLSRAAEALGKSIAPDGDTLIRLVWELFHPVDTYRAGEICMRLARHGAIPRSEARSLVVRRAMGDDFILAIPLLASWGDEEIPTLIEILKTTQSVHSRRTILRELQSRCLDEVRDVLIEYAGSDDQEVAQRSLSALASMGDPELLEMFIDLYEDAGDARLRGIAANAFERTPGLAARREIERLLETESDPKWRKELQNARTAQSRLLKSPCGYEP